MIPKSSPSNDQLSFTMSHQNEYYKPHKLSTSSVISEASAKVVEQLSRCSIVNKSNHVFLPTQFNQLGEAVLPQAPRISIAYKKNKKKQNKKNENKQDDGLKQSVPQQFLHYQRTRENVEYIINKVNYDKSLPLFVHEENGHLFLQVGIIGFENYPKDKITKNRPKIVYGRRWYIEPYMPTSEVIQTAFVALQKAREHELREYFYMSVDVDGRLHRTTPFNTHMDLPLMASNPELFSNDSQVNHQSDAFISESLTLKEQIENQLSQLQFAGLNFQLTRFENLDELIILSVTLLTGDDTDCMASKHFSEQLNATHHLVFDSSQPDLEPISNRQGFMDAMIYKLFDAMMQTSYQHLSQHFTYDGFARFDQSISPQDIAIFSAKTRLIAEEDKTPTFTKSFKQMVAIVDSAKAPMYAQNIYLYSKQKQAICSKDLDGYLPYIDKEIINLSTFQHTNQEYTNNAENNEHISEIVAMAWCDKTSFDDIEFQTGLSEQQVISLMRTNLKRASFKVWRKRVTGRLAKHRQLDTSRNHSSNHTNKVRKMKNKSTRSTAHKRLSYS